MKKIVRGVTCAGCLLAATLLGNGPAAADEAVNFRIAGGVGPDLSAIAVYAEYEMMSADNLSVLVRGGYLNYEHDDDGYEEDGDGPGIEAGLRVYPRGKTDRGMFVGFLAGIWDTDWDWVDHKGRPSETRGSGSTVALNIGVEFGGKISMGDRVYLMPAVQVGNWSGLDEDCEPAGCDKKTELGFYAVGSIGLGVVF